MPPFNYDRRPSDLLGSTGEPQLDSPLTEGVKAEATPAAPTVGKPEGVITTSYDPSQQELKNHFEMNGSASFTRGVDGTVTASHVVQENGQFIQKTEVVPHLEGNPNIRSAEAPTTQPVAPEAGPQEKGVAAWSRFKQNMNGFMSKAAGLKDRISTFASGLKQGAIRSVDSLGASAVVTGYEAAAGVSRAARFAGEKAVALQERGVAAMRKTEGLVESAITKCVNRVEKSRAERKEYMNKVQYFKAVTPLNAQLTQLFERFNQNADMAALRSAEDAEKAAALAEITQRYDRIRTNMHSERERTRNLIPQIQARLLELRQKHGMDINQQIPLPTPESYNQAA